jgi:hypothetical protein
MDRGVPRQQKLANCNSNALAFTMACEPSPPYQFVLGTPHQAPLAFRGEITIQQNTELVARIPISSDFITPCSGLSGLDAYLLTGSRTNTGERLGELLHPGQNYDVRVDFFEMPPRGSSFWFTSIAKSRRQ